MDVTVVPARAVYLVREGSRDGFRRAVQEASTRWAGMTEPIVPVQGDGNVEDWARTVVEFARVDGAVNVDLPDEEAAAVAAALGLDCVRIDDIDRWGITSRTCHPSAVGPARLPGQSVVIASPPGELWQVTAAGDLPPDHLVTIDHSILSVRPGAGPDDVGRAQLSDTTLLHRTLASFGETIGSQAPLTAPTVVWITEPDDLDDCWDFWNARALAPIRYGPMPMILLPRDQIQHWLKFDMQFHHALRRRAEFTPDVLLTSSNVPEAGLGEIAGLLHLERTEDDIVRGENFSALLRTPPFTYRTVPNLRPFVSFRRVYGVSTQVDVHVFDSGTTARFASPVAFRGGYTLMRFGGAPFQGLPRRSAIAKLVEKNAIWREDAIQISTNAWEYHYTFQLQIPSLQQATHALAAEATTRYQPSDKGQLATGIQRNIDLAVLRQPSLFNVIRQLTTPRTEQFLTKAKKQFNGHAQIDKIIEKLKPLAEEWGARSERKMATAYDLRGGATPDNIAALEQLCDLGWAERGLRLRCTDCRVDTFIPLNDVAPRASATCRGCGSRQNYARGKSEVSIFYRLDSLVDRASDQGAIPHLITIAELTRREPHSWFLPGVDAWFTDRTNKLEADIFGIYGGQVAVGEVKTSGSEFTEDQITGDIERCTRLHADRYIMAATDTITDEAQSTAQRLCTDANLDLLVLTSADLMPNG
jgi:hypothetical protein